MLAKTTFQALDEHGWSRGLPNLFSNEMRQWWFTRQWLVQTLIWLLIINGILAAALFSPEPDAELAATAEQASAETQQETMFTGQDRIFEGRVLFTIIGGMIPVIGAILVMQGAMIDEKKTGTAAWILSKPVSRTAFILAKLLAHGISTLSVMILFQGIAAYLLISFRASSFQSLLPFLFALALMGLHFLFYLTLTLMLGTIFSERAPVIGIPIAIHFGAQMIAGMVPWLIPFMPWGIILPFNNPSLAMLAISEQTLTEYTAIFATISWILLFIGVSIWRFEREEF